MGILDRVQTGRQRRPLTVCIYGVPGVGKTTFAASAPKPLVFCIERGAESLDVAKLQCPPSWQEFLASLHELVEVKHDYQTLVVDTLDALEVIATSHVCTLGKKATLADFSWGAGYALLVQEWRLFLHALEQIRDRRAMNVVLIAHEHRKDVDDPELGRFAMYRPKLQDKVWGVTNEWSDAVLFAQFDQALMEKEGQRARAIITGRRILRTVRGTGYVAKNRYGLPETLDLDWKTFETAAQPATVAELKKRFVEAVSKAPEEVQVKAKAYLADRGETPETLRAAIERVHTILAEKAA